MGGIMTLSGSNEFDKLREHMNGRRDVRREVEFAFSSLLTAANPSDRGLRFLFGNGAEWIMAAAAWSAGILTAPGGHNVNGFDLGDLLNRAKGLWSVKASASAHSSPVRLKNFMGDGAGADWTEPTVFVGPYLGGAVLIDPKVHREVRSKMVQKKDALVISASVIKKFAMASPQNVISFDVAINSRVAISDQYSFIKSVIAPEHFPILAKPFLAAAPPVISSRVEEIKRLAELRDEGLLDDEQFKKAVASIL